MFRQIAHWGGMKNLKWLPRKLKLDVPPKQKLFYNLFFRKIFYYEELGL